MGENTNIEWADHTFNPWIGCDQLSPACDHCYAKSLVERYGGDFAVRHRTSNDNWKLPARWNRKAARPYSAEALLCRPGDLLLHPRTRAPVAKVIACTHKTVLRKKRPAKHTVIIVCEDL